MSRKAHRDVVPGSRDLTISSQPPLQKRKTDLKSRSVTLFAPVWPSVQIQPGIHRIHVIKSLFRFNWSGQPGRQLPTSQVYPSVSYLSIGYDIFSVIEAAMKRLFSKLDIQKQV